MKYLITGSERSGVFLIASLINCSNSVSFDDPQNAQKIICLEECDLKTFENSSKNFMILPISQEVSNQLGMSLIDRISYLTVLGYKVIWTVRHPVTSACSYMYHWDMSAKDALKYWYRVNMSLWYALENRKHLVIRFEEILKNKILVKDLFNFCELSFNDQFLNYGDFDPLPFQHSSMRFTKLDPEMADSYNLADFRGLEKVWQEYKLYPFVLNFDFQNIGIGE